MIVFMIIWRRRVKTILIQPRGWVMQRNFNKIVGIRLKRSPLWKHQLTVSLRALSERELPASTQTNSMLSGQTFAKIIALSLSLPYNIQKACEI